MNFIIVRDKFLQTIRKNFKRDIVEYSHFSIPHSRKINIDQSRMLTVIPPYERDFIIRMTITYTDEFVVGVNSGGARYRVPLEIGEIS